MRDLTRLDESEIAEIPPQIRIEIEEIDKFVVEDMDEWNEHDWACFDGTDEEASEHFRKAAEHGRIDWLALQELIPQYERRGMAVIPIFGSLKSWCASDSDEVDCAYEAILQNIPTISIQSSDWKQVLEFRDDDEALRKLRDLRLWVLESLARHSVQHATDMIGKKIDDYCWAIRKHGFETRVGLVSLFLEPKTLTTVAALSTAAGLVGGPLWSALAVGLSCAGNVGTYIAKRTIDLAAVKRGQNSEIAYLYDINQEFRE